MNPERANPRGANPLALAIFGDFPEEKWPSMDLCGEMLLAQLNRRELASEVIAREMRPRFRRRLHWHNADRLLNRLIDYPRHAQRVRQFFDCFHIVDHSYAQLVHELPVGRTGVFCHDLDAFRCLIEPARDRRPAWFRALARRTLRGLQRAAVVFHSTDAVRDEIRRHHLTDPARLVKAPCGVAPEFTPHAHPLAMPELPDDFVLHVGSCVPRKRIDVLLDAVAQSNVNLIQVGGEWTDEQRAQIARLQIGAHVVQLPHQPREVLAELYRRAQCVLVTSDAEGFGLPIVEALACGAAVVASDIPALREAGGDAVKFCPMGDADAFASSIVLDDAPTIDARLRQAARFSWREHAQIILRAYETIVKR